VANLGRDFDYEEEHLNSGGVRVSCGDDYVDVTPDMYPEDPRVDWDCWIGRMACHHSRYLIGDDDTLKGWRDCDTLRDVVTWCRDNYGASVVLPLYLYDHGGISLSYGGSLKGDGSDVVAAGGWDSGIVGFVFDDAERMRVHDLDDADVLSALQGEVLTYNQYLSGDVWVINDSRDDMGCVGGFYGFDEAVDEAVHALRGRWWRDVEAEARVMDWARGMGDALRLAESLAGGAA